MAGGLRTHGQNDESAIIRTSWQISAMICSQYYSQREWVVGKVVADPAGGASTFEMSTPLSFYSTFQLMKEIHENIGQETIAVQVVEERLHWSVNSFVKAEVARAKVVISNLASACKCGVMPRKSGDKPGKRKAATKQAKKDHTGCTGALEDDHGSGAESDASLLDALAEALDNWKGRGVDVDDDLQEHQTEGAEQDLQKINALSAAVASSSKYRGSIATSASTSAADQGTAAFGDVSGDSLADLVETQRVEDALDACHLKDAVSKLASSSSSSHSTGGKAETTGSFLLGGDTAASGALVQHLQNVRQTYKDLIGPEEEAQEGLMNLASFPEEAAPKAAKKQQSNEIAKREELARQEAKISQWAGELSATAAAFALHAGHFFPDRNDFGQSMVREISLVQFVEETCIQEGDAFPDMGSLPAPEASLQEPDGDTEPEPPSTYMQFVFWDFVKPPRLVGRRLRLEAGRFVWKPPARNMDDDDLGSLFTAGSARVILVHLAAFGACYIFILVQPVQQKWVSRAAMQPAQSLPSN